MAPTAPSLQQRVSDIRVPRFDELHKFAGVPDGFLPWTCGLSPSALYTCSLRCRKQSGTKTPETKWMSIKRWMQSTPSGISLPDGVFYSIKRHEVFEPFPKPRFVKTPFVLLMFPYGNVWSSRAPNVPIDEDWLLSDHDGSLILERLMRKDAAYPLGGYFASVLRYMQDFPGQIGIHLKRRRQSQEGPVTP